MRKIHRIVSAPESAFVRKHTPLSVLSRKTTAFPERAFRRKEHLISRHSFIQQSKLHNVKGRIDYISNPKRQENLYATYETVDREFWDYLAEQNRYDFKKSGSHGQCIEARELIIALPEEFTRIGRDGLLKVFTEKFRMEYGVECISALHHNKTRTNYHIHLIYSERKILEHKERKTAARNMFYDENGRHVRTKKEVTDEHGKLRPGCRMISKGEVYELNYFAPKGKVFKSRDYLKDVKEMFTGLINEFVRDEDKKLSVFDKDGPYLPTKKIGRNNPLADEIRADNAARQEWNLAVDEAVVTGIPEREIVKMKYQHITMPVRSSIQKHGSEPTRLRDILIKAAGILRSMISAFRAPALVKPEIVIDLDEFCQMQRIKNTLDKIMGRIRRTDAEIATVDKELLTLTGIAGLMQKTRRKELSGERTALLEYRNSQSTLLHSTVKKEGYKTVAEFMKQYNRIAANIQSHQAALKTGRRSNVRLKNTARISVNEQLNTDTSARQMQRKEQKRLVRSSIGER